MGSAVISKCKKYRYVLRRDTGLLSPTISGCLFVMLNPSTADANIDDPTLRRCIGFAKSWGSASVVTANLYAYRATIPKELWRVSDPVGPRNNRWLRALLTEYEEVICAWGTNARADRVAEFIKLADQCLCRTRCLGVSKYGAPRHPLYIKADQEPMLYRPV